MKRPMPVTGSMTPFSRPPTCKTHIRPTVDTRLSLTRHHITACQIKSEAPVLYQDGLLPMDETECYHRYARHSDMTLH